MRLSSVLLPQPEWPMSDTHSPWAMRRSMPCSAWKRPFLVSNTISAPSMLMKFCMVGPQARVSRSVIEGEALGQGHQRLLQQQAHHADDDDGDDDVLHVEVVPL